MRSRGFDELKALVRRRSQNSNSTIFPVATGTARHEDRAPFDRTSAMSLFGPSRHFAAVPQRSRFWSKADPKPGFPAGERVGVPDFRRAHGRLANGRPRRPADQPAMRRAEWSHVRYRRMTSSIFRPKENADQRTCSPLCDCVRSNNPHHQASHPYQKTHKANCILPSLEAPHQGDIHASDIFESSWRNTDCRNNGSDRRRRRTSRTQGTLNGDPAIPQQQCLRRTW